MQLVVFFLEIGVLTSTFPCRVVVPIIPLAVPVLEGFFSFALSILSPPHHIPPPFSLAKIVLEGALWNCARVPFPFFRSPTRGSFPINFLLIPSMALHLGEGKNSEYTSSIGRMQLHDFCLFLFYF